MLLADMTEELADWPCRTVAIALLFGVDSEASKLRTVFPLHFRNIPDDADTASRSRPLSPLRA